MSAARYKITRKIADGGMAELYLGVQRGAAGFERKIVIKRVRAAYVADPATRETLVDEAHVAMSLNHSSIVQVLDLGFSAGRYFLVLELVHGWDLSVLLDRAKQADLPLPPELALHIAAEVCRALAFAHGKTKEGGAPLGIVHRDLNPHNVLVSEQGEVKLTDFGIATAKTRRRATTLVGVVKGKLGFMSPEQAKGEDALDSRSDLFSMGCTLYQMVTGVQPFAGGTELEMLLRMEQCAFKSVEEAKPDLAPELKAILQKAMQKSPADRFASAEAMLADLERVQRSSFKPAGQSELKAWLAELTRRDHVPTIGRRETAAAAAFGELPAGRDAGPRRDRVGPRCGPPGRELRDGGRRWRRRRHRQRPRSASGTAHADAAQAHARRGADPGPDAADPCAADCSGGPEAHGRLAPGEPPSREQPSRPVARCRRGASRPASLADGLGHLRRGHRRGHGTDRLAGARVVPRRGHCCRRRHRPEPRGEGVRGRLPLARGRRGAVRVDPFGRGRQPGRKAGGDDSAGPAPEGQHQPRGALRASPATGSRCAGCWSLQARRRRR
ncbi:MAG: serine/threonine-protein kinase [Myxococcales bacterium]